jgi:curved DNA-binding protein CbpA
MRMADRLPGVSSTALRRVKHNTAATNEIEQLLGSKLPLIDKGADHFALLGVTPDTTPDHLRSAYFALARQLHPDRLAAAGITDERREAQRLFAQINSAFGILSNPKRRADYLALVHKGGETAIRAEEAEAEKLAAKIFGAEEHFRRGEMALRREQLEMALEEFKQAVALNPAEGEHHALLGWATYCTAPDKSKVRTQVRQLFDEAIKHAPRSVTPYLYLGRIARLEGRDAEAIEHFQRVMSTMPGHTEAASELRLLESRRAGRPSKPPPDEKPKGGLFGFIKKS